MSPCLCCAPIMSPCLCCAPIMSPCLSVLPLPYNQPPPVLCTYLAWLGLWVLDVLHDTFHYLPPALKIKLDDI
ncbi:hypothetical protein GDO81_018554 [Engystomops pustulosus]|uniref:Uncharacterized protein n=1 Tax=Engystomops pustulosus TaxID=76066 RepID=A0AAV6YHG0_ENGPU|nr:hypothetical protein GDO81_018554 [Engystomops pustulosus]